MTDSDPTAFAALRLDLQEERSWEIEDSDLRSRWAAFLGRYPLEVFFTCTFSDRYAQRHSIFSPTSALNDFQRWLDALAFDQDYFVTAESHFDRDVPHLHGLLANPRKVGLSTMWGAWFAKRGRARFEEPRSDAAAIYCAKYALKERNPDLLRFRLAGLESQPHPPRNNTRTRKR